VGGGLIYEGGGGDTNGGLTRKGEDARRVGKGVADRTPAKENGRGWSLSSRGRGPVGTVKKKKGVGGRGGGRGVIHIGDGKSGGDGHRSGGRGGGRKR